MEDHPSEVIPSFLYPGLSLSDTEIVTVDDEFSLSLSLPLGSVSVSTTTSSNPPPPPPLPPGFSQGVCEDPVRLGDLLRPSFVT